MSDAQHRLRPATADDLVAIGRLHAVAARRAYAGIFPADSTPPTPDELSDEWRALLADPDPLADVLVATVPGPAGAAAEGSHDEATHGDTIGVDTIGVHTVGGDTVTDDTVGEDTVVGAVAVGPAGGIPTGLLLHKLYVDPERQGRGLGVALHDLALSRARERGAEAINLWVLEANTAARRLYERNGWRLVPGRTLANEPPSIVDVLYERRLEPDPRPAPDVTGRA